MVLPSTYNSALFLLILSILCWGSWTVTFKSVGRWRFELFAIDFAFGVVLCSVLAAATFGSLGSELTFSDRMLVAGHFSQALAFLSGCVFSLANMLILAAISMAGIAVVLPVAFGLSIGISVLWIYLSTFQGNPVFAFGGAGLLLIGAVVIVTTLPAIETLQAPQNSKTKKVVAGRALLLTIISGLVLGCFNPLVATSMTGELGLGPYATLILVSAGVFVSTLFLNVYFMNLPVVGERLNINSYFRGTAKQHFLGMAGGVALGLGLLTSFLSSATQSVDSNVSYFSIVLGQSGALIAFLLGVSVWKELSGTRAEVKTVLAIGVVCFTLGIITVSFAHLQR